MFELILIGLIAGYILAAPDRTTASIRGGAAGAVGSVARSARTGWGQSAATRSSRAASKRAARLARWSGQSVDSEGESVPAPWSGRFLLWLDRTMSGDGPVARGAQAVGRVLQSGWESARDGWRSGRASAQPGPPQAARDGLAWLQGALGITQPDWDDGPSAQAAAIPEPTDSTPNPQPSGPDQPAGAIEGKSMSNAITAEAGLLNAAEKIQAPTADIAALIAAAHAARGLAESLAFDPGSEVSHAIAALAEVAPDPAALGAFAEMAAALVEAVRTQSANLIGA